MEKSNKSATAKASDKTKKDRRASKVQEKQSTDQKPASKQPPNKAPAPANSAPLTEKQLRKLEWEKKLADQKPQAAAKDDVSKAELKLKRRDQQEAQRLAKAPKPELPPVSQKKSPTKPPKKIEAKKITDSGKLQLVNHLATEFAKSSLYDSVIVNFKNVHPAFVKLGVQYSTKRVLGSNARCLALLSAVQKLIRDLKTPPQQEFCRYLGATLKSCVAFLQYCRPLAVSMTSALRYLNVRMQEAESLEENQKKEFLLNSIKTYINDEINKAGEAISLKVQEKITNGDTILTYGCSSLIRRILLDAHKDGKHFKVIVVDGRPFLEGRQMLQRLVQAGVQCSYVQINAISYVMGLATKILLGAHALLTNGHVMSRIGTAQVALVAKAYNKPVLVCCETYKFSERVQTDSFVYNELGDVNMLTVVDTVEEVSPLVQARSDDSLSVLNLLYDVTPPDLVTAVVTELAILPCTSAPVVLRIKPTEFA